jgi:hypothetical protein
MTVDTASIRKQETNSKKPEATLHRDRCQHCNALIGEPESVRSRDHTECDLLTSPPGDPRAGGPPCRAMYRAVSGSPTVARAARRLECVVRIYGSAAAPSFLLIGNSSVIYFSDKQFLATTHLGSNMRIRRDLDGANATPLRSKTIEFSALPIVQGLSIRPLTRPIRLSSRAQKFAFIASRLINLGFVDKYQALLQNLVRHQARSEEVTNWRSMFSKLDVCVVIVSLKKLQGRQ